MSLFLYFYLEVLCVSLEVKFHSGYRLSQGHISKDADAGTGLSNLGNPNEAKKYVLALVRKLLLQREKRDLGIQLDDLQSDIVSLWLKVLSMLENHERKVVGVQSGSLIFTLFCPTITSKRELRNVSWIKSLTSKMENFVKKIG